MMQLTSSRFLALPGALLLATLLAPSVAAQSARTSAGSRSAIYPPSIEATGQPHPQPFAGRYSVWFEVPRDAAGPLDVELVSAGRPALLDVSITPPLAAAVVPGTGARFTVTLRGRPAFAGGEFALVFRDARTALDLGSIPVTLERGVGGPRSAKESALATLSELRAEVAAGAFTMGERDQALAKLAHAIEELQESLDPEFWQKDEFGVISQDHLDPEDGHHVFHEERESAQKIFDAIRQGEIGDEGLVAELLAIVDTLVLADRRLAEVALEDAQAAGADPEEFLEARVHFQEGDELLEAAAGESDLRIVAALLYTAMDGAYRHAWEEALDSF
jgi:hypothetical protein